MSETHVEHQNAGVGIATVGEWTEQIYYLLEGQVEVVAEDGKRLTCQADQPCSLSPLAEKSPNKDHITCVSAVDLLCIPRELHDAIKRLPPVANARTNQT
ncbi:MAG: hypothetical protein AB2765_02985, partial [Candidatus Thiodiazotropha endolucinida]